MRIAICISGFIRIWKYTKKSFLEQLIDGNENIDIFIHTYIQNYYESTSGNKDEILTDDDFSRLFEDVNVKSLVIENRDEILPKIMEDASRYKHTHNFESLQPESSDPNHKKIPIGVRTYDHLRKVHLCNENRKAYEKEHDIKYDLVVKTRFDIVYFNKVNWKNMCDGRLHLGYGATWGYPDDTFCVTIPKLMDTMYANRFTAFDEIFLEKKELGAGVCAHYTLRYMINKYNVGIGDPAVNILCFRSKTSVQYGGNYRFRCDLCWLYDTLTSLNISDVKKLETEKNRVLKF